MGKRFFKNTKKKERKRKARVLLNSVLYNVTSYPTWTAVQKTDSGVILFLAYTTCSF